MKIRILGDSVRFRLSQGEVRQLSKTGSVAETTHFGGSDNRLIYSIQAYGGNLVEAQFIQNEIRAMVPKAVVEQWAESNQVSIKGQMPIDDNQHLAILIEKDFKCLDSGRKEDESDLFPNPKEGSLEC